MIFKIYKYNRPPSNPKIKPRPFQNKYYKTSFEYELSENFKLDLIEFFMKMTLIFGDEMKCHFKEILSDSNNTINKNIYKNYYDLIHPNFKNIIQDNDFLIKPYCDPRFFYTDIFIDCILNFENCHINEKFQVAINPRNNLIISFYDFNFQKPIDNSK